MLKLASLNFYMLSRFAMGYMGTDPLRFWRRSEFLTTKGW